MKKYGLNLSIACPKKGAVMQIPAVLISRANPANVGPAPNWA